MPSPNRGSSVTSTLTVADRFRGMLLGTAVGDSVGLPAEGISPRRARKLFGDRWRQRLLFNRGMLSDDTEHTLFVAQSLLVHPTSCQRFARRLAWCLRWWLMSLPAALDWPRYGRSCACGWVSSPRGVGCAQPETVRPCDPRSSVPSSRLSPIVWTITWPPRRRSPTPLRLYSRQDSGP